MTTILLCTVPMILGLIFIYRSFRSELRDSEIGVKRTSDNTIEHFYDIKSQIETERMLFMMEIDSKIMALRNDTVYLSTRKYDKKEQELQAYLEFLFREDSDKYAMNQKIEKVKEEYAK